MNGLWILRNVRDHRPATPENGLVDTDRGETGLTLVEVLAALVVLSIGILGLLGLATTVMQGDAASQMRTASVFLAEDKIEQVRFAGYNASLVSTSTVTEPYNSIPGYPLFQRATVTQVNTPAAGMQTVTTTVTWQSPQTNYGATSVTLSTVLAP